MSNAETFEFEVLKIDNPNIEITGIDGLRTLLAMVRDAWWQGKTVTIENVSTVIFKPTGDKPEHIYFEISPTYTEDEVKKFSSGDKMK